MVKYLLAELVGDSGASAPGASGTGRGCCPVAGLALG